MGNKKKLFLLFILLFPMYVHADVKEHRACILKVASERKESLKEIKQSRKEFQGAIEKAIDEASKKETLQFESNLSELKKQRNAEIQKANALTDRQEKHTQLEKTKIEYLKRIESLEAERSIHIKEINEEYKKTKIDLSIKYKKFIQDTWKTFVENKNKCVKV